MENKSLIKTNSVLYKIKKFLIKLFRIKTKTNFSVENEETIENELNLKLKKNLIYKSEAKIEEKDVGTEKSNKILYKELREKANYTILEKVSEDDKGNLIIYLEKLKEKKKKRLYEINRKLIIKG